MSCVPSLHQLHNQPFHQRLPVQQQSVAALAVSSQSPSVLPPTPVRGWCGDFNLNVTPNHFRYNRYRYNQANHFGCVAFNRSYHLYRLYLEGTLKSIKIPLSPLFLSATSFGTSHIRLCNTCSQVPAGCSPRWWALWPKCHSAPPPAKPWWVFNVFMTTKIHKIWGTWWNLGYKKTWIDMGSDTFDGSQIWSPKFCL